MARNNWQRWTGAARSWYPNRRRLRIEPLEDRRLLSITVNTLVDENDGIGVAGISLRDAITAAAPADTIDFAPALTAGGPATILLTHGELVINKSLTINGPGASLLAIDASGSDPTPDADNSDGSRVFNVNDNKNTNLLNVTISSLTLTGGDVSSGGAIFTRESLMVIDCTISGNSAHFGGGITANPTNLGQLRLINSTVSGNTLTANSTHYGVGAGAGIDASGPATCTMTVAGSTISGNAALGDLGVFKGGGIYCGFNLVVTDSTISNNSFEAERSYGGGIYHYQGNISITGTTISGNTALRGGGGIFNHYGALSVTNSTISGNSAGWPGFSPYGYGGGIAARSSPVTLTNSSIANNTTSVAYLSSGGGIWSYKANVTATGSTITGNSAFNGGGISTVGYVKLALSNCTVTSNSARRDGGGIFHADFYSRCTITQSTVTRNSADRNGGGIYETSLLVAVASTISDNTAGGNGGGIYGSAQIESCAIIDNSADSGGGIWSDEGTTISNTTISGNRAVVGGGVFVELAFPAYAIRHSTVAQNRASSIGGGIFVSKGTLSLDHALVAGNFTEMYFFPSDLTGLIGVGFLARYSLIGNKTGSGLAEAPVGSPDANGNLIGGDVSIYPYLGPLADNGGPTMTHALQFGSPAINAGDPAAVAGVAAVPQFDQRGAPFGRVAGGRIDIGAFESQPIPPAIFGDYNQDGNVDAGDCVVWRKMLGSSVASYTSADGSGNGIVDQADYSVWRAHFGQSVPVASAAGAAAATSVAIEQPIMVTTQLAPPSSENSAPNLQSSAPSPTTRERDEAIAQFDPMPTIFQRGHSRPMVRRHAAFHLTCASIGPRADKSELSSLALSNDTRSASEQGDRVDAPSASAIAKEAVETAGNDSLDGAFATIGRVLRSTIRLLPSMKPET